MSDDYTINLEKQNEELKQLLAKAQALCPQWRQISPKRFHFCVGEYAIARVEEFNSLGWVAMIIQKGFNEGTGGYSEHLTITDAMMYVQNEIASNIWATTQKL